jgi:integrase
VSALDKAVRQGELSWKTAIHAWGTCTKLFDDAARGKDLTLRCLETNPARDVRGPDRGHDRASAFLFPAELHTLLSRETVPLARRRLYALAVYLGCRAGELRALEWDDVHEGEGFVHVHRSHDIHSGKAKSTKTGITRRVPIEPALLPLLEAMREESSGKGKVLAIGSAWELPRCLRADLKEAEVTRAELEADDATRRPLDFHDLRHTYGTLRAIRGDDVIKIRFAMGHTDLTTTQRYINEAHVFEGARFGVPFGPLPPSLFNRGDYVIRGSNSSKLQRPQRELNPCYRRERPVS